MLHSTNCQRNGGELRPQRLKHAHTHTQTWESQKTHHRTSEKSMHAGLWVCLREFWTSCLKICQPMQSCYWSPALTFTSILHPSAHITPSDSHAQESHKDRVHSDIVALKLSHQTASNLCWFFTDSQTTALILSWNLYNYEFFFSFCCQLLPICTAGRGGWSSLWETYWDS